MALIRPRFTDHHSIFQPQAELDFAIPFLDEDIPLYADPFLLWKSPSQQDQALHTSIINSFNHLGYLKKKGKEDQALNNLIIASECDEVGLGLSKKKKGQRISPRQAVEILNLFSHFQTYSNHGFTHFEEIQLYVEGISKDRISDFTCSFIKSFLIDFTIDQCKTLGIPTETTKIDFLYNYQKHSFEKDVKVELPVHPINKNPILLAPKRWLRFSPWINFEDYFKDYCPRDEIFNPNEPESRVKVLNFNRHNYGMVENYVHLKERKADDCKNDPLFQQIPVISAKRKFSEIKKLPTGKEDNADKLYEDLASPLLASLLYPQLDFAQTQSRTESGVIIRDLIFYNNRSFDFLEEILEVFGNRQLVMELKNVKAVERIHINQLNRYLAEGIGNFGVLLTRNPLPKAIFKNAIDLWSGQRKCIIALTDADLELMVEIFDSKQRLPIEVVKKKYIEFRRACPS